jgi:glyoxylase-like metal-dependent hydrolase (beta-lactamase superfamily II)
MSKHPDQAGSSLVAQDVHRLSGGVANFYLIHQGGRFTLVDAGTPGDWGLFHRSLAAMGRRLEDLEAVVLAHAHADHTGFAERIRAATRTPVCIHERDSHVAAGVASTVPPSP